MEVVFTRRKPRPLENSTILSIELAQSLLLLLAICPVTVGITVKGYLVAAKADATSDSMTAPEAYLAFLTIS